MRYSLLLVILAISVSSSFAQIELDSVWIKRYAKRPGNQPHEIPAGLGVDNNGNVYVTMSEAVDEWRQWITLSYQGDGSLRWDVNEGSENGFIEPAGLAVEENGSNVYVTGYCRIGENGKDDFFTVNYDGSYGEAVWKKSFGLEDHDRAKAITMDDDYVYVTGYVDMATSGPTREDHAFCTIKYKKSTGETAWVRTYDPDTNDQEEACALAVHNGNVYVTGRAGWNTRWDFLTISYDSSGNLRPGWPQWHDDPGGYDDVPKAIAVDTNGNVYVTGYSEQSSTNSDIFTISYKSDGSFRWQKTYNGTDDREDSANAIALDKVGHVYVTGSCKGSDSLDNYITIKYDTNGVRDTIGVYDHDLLRDEAISIAVEDSGKYIYVTGEVKEDDDDGSYYTIVYDSVFNIVAYDQYDGPGNPTSTEDFANKIAIDKDFIYVTGASMDTSFNRDNFDCVTIKYGKYQDVGCSTIVALIGTVDSGTAVTPACSVFNYGKNYPTYQVRMKIGNPSNPLYNYTGWAAAHEPGSLQYVTFFPSYANWPRGKHPVRCSTEYANDMNKSNDRKIDTIIVRVKDVGCSKIIVPTGTIDSGTVVTPACSVYNFGTTTESYDVRMKIGNYNRTASVTSHLPDSLKYVTFPLCTLFLQRGNNTVSCSTELATDANKPNDKKTGSFLVAVHDVGCEKIITPTGTIDSGNVVVAPTCSVYNYGTTPENYRVRMKIDNFYNETTYVSYHTPGTLRYITFPGWVVLQRGNHVVKCSTELATDMYKTNDLKTGSVFVRVVDIGCSTIVAPKGTIDSGTVVTPACSVYNYGNVDPPLMPYSVRMKIGRFYDQTSYVTRPHNPGTAICVTFRDWVATQVGTHTVTCSTQLSFDMNKINDKNTGSVTVVRGKGGGLNNKVTEITIDSGGIEAKKPDDDNSKKIEHTTESNDSVVISPIYQTYNQGNMGSTIQIKTEINGVAILRIYNVLGKLLHSEKTNDDLFKMDGLPTGIYILRLQTKNRTEIRKLLIVK
jgi:hypothetical protein